MRSSAEERPELPSIVVRRIRDTEGLALMQIRLEALLDTPEAFESTYESASLRPVRAWEERAAAASSGDDETIMIAESESRWVGMAGAFTSNGNVKTIYGMWMKPEWRRRGIAARLLSAIKTWAAGAEDLRLWVVEDNVAALALYRSNGFSPTGERGSTPRMLEEIEMRLSVE